LRLGLFELGYVTFDALIAGDAADRLLAALAHDRNLGAIATVFVQEVNDALTLF